jgi:hypothetical protein
MIITYHGENYFKIQAGNLLLLVDPLNERSFRGADLVIRTDMAENKDLSEPLLIDSPGEYEVRGIRLSGFNLPLSKGKKTFYRLFFDEIWFGILGRAIKEPDAKTLAPLRNVDILIIAADGKPPLSERTVVNIIRNLEPGIIIPSYIDSRHPPQKFLKELDKKCEVMEKLVLKKKDVEPGAMAVKCLRV